MGQTRRRAIADQRPRLAGHGELVGRRAAIVEIQVDQAEVELAQPDLLVVTAGTHDAL